MPATNVTFDIVRKIGLALPGVEEGTMYGSPALKVHGRLLRCLAIHKSAEAASLVVRTDFDERAALLAEEPQTYYLTDHYVNHPVVLGRYFALKGQGSSVRDAVCERCHDRQTTIGAADDDGRNNIIAPANGTRENLPPECSQESFWSKPFGAGHEIIFEVRISSLHPNACRRCGNHLTIDGKRFAFRD
jgi:hypothetical protein